MGKVELEENEERRRGQDEVMGRLGERERKLMLETPQNWIKKPYIIVGATGNLRKDNFY
jgi:hypothetical protein